MRIQSPGTRPALSPAVVRRVVGAVLEGERSGKAAISVTFLTSAGMRALNRRSFGRDRATDVIAFSLPHDGVLAGDVYICPAAARAAARELDVPAREELIRLVVHGTLHVLGMNHPDGAGRTKSAMWRRQERYVQKFSGARA